MRPEDQIAYRREQQKQAENSRAAAVARQQQQQQRDNDARNREAAQARQRAFEDRERANQLRQEKKQRRFQDEQKASDAYLKRQKERWSKPWSSQPTFTPPSTTLDYEDVTKEPKAGLEDGNPVSVSQDQERLGEYVSFTSCLYDRSFCRLPRVFSSRG